MTSQSEWRLETGNEWVSRDPFGVVKPADVSKEQFPVAGDGGVRLRAARNGYASLRLWVVGSGEYRLSAQMAGPVEVDLFKAWYHKMAPGKEAEEPRYCVDALLPVAGGSLQQLPDPDNAVAGQTHQEYWIAVFVPADAPVGPAEGRLTLAADAERVELPLTVEVLDAVIPDEDAVICDHNSYGCRWIEGMYPGVFAGLDGDERWGAIIEILHHYYRICHEHRGMLSNLGSGHAGTIDEVYVPTLSGAGAGKGIEDWTLFDRHYAALLDGTAFATAGPGAPAPRRPARPVWGFYSPIHVDWPGDYLWWGREGYEVEFTRCVGQFDKHFRDKGWLTTRPYLYLNHKKRYRWYEWDGDEPKYAKDDVYFLEMGRLLKKAVGDTPVPWLFRMDASWQMASHFTKFAGTVDYWVCGGFANWYPEQIKQTIARGDTVWTYSGTPAIDQTSAALLEHVWRMWARGVGGHCEWLTVRPGPDPWLNCDGAETGMIYPGERFGIAGPIPSARLKIQRNAVQDVNLIDARARAEGRLEEVRSAMGESTPVTLWQDPPPVVLAEPPENWDSINLSATQDDNMARHAGLDALWWAPIRRAAMGQEAKS